MMCLVMENLNKFYHSVNYTRIQLTKSLPIPVPCAMDAMYRTAAVEMFHRGADLVRKETLAYNPNDHASSAL
jgi:hypothetical protein